MLIKKGTQIQVLPTSIQKDDGSYTITVKETIQTLLDNLIPSKINEDLELYTFMNKK